MDTTLWLAGAGIPALALLGLPWLRRMDQFNAARLAEIEPRIAVLQGAGLLAEASRGTLEQLAAGATPVVVAAGDVLIREGEPADALHVVEDGKFAVRARGAGPTEQELPSMGGPGAYFGEIGLLEQIPRTATVQATTPGRVLRVDGDAFLTALTSSAASPSLLEGARTRLARTPYPARQGSARSGCSDAPATHRERRRDVIAAALPAAPRCRRRRGSRTGQRRCRREDSPSRSGATR